jgi:radical SAM protein with 4Fe4S-binding SPASM domain
MSGKSRNRFRIAASYFNRNAVLGAGPLEITVESTSKCNLDCPMCPRQIHTFESANMDLGLYGKIIRDSQECVELVWPYGIGEPMIHPEIFDMIRLTRSAGIHTGLSTNATLLDDSRAEITLDCGLDYIILAFDGATKETYEKYRFRATFEKTRTNILQFLKKKLERNSPIYVVLQMVLLKDNMAEIHAYKRLWSLPGVNEVRFKRDEIQIKGSAHPASPLVGRRRNPCHLLWRGPLYVRHDGVAYPCCYMYNNKPVGDLKAQSLMEVWNSEGMVNLRQAHISGDLSSYPTCQTCQAPRPNRSTFYGSLVLDSLAVRKLVPVAEKMALFYNLGVFEKDSG